MQVLIVDDNRYELKGMESIVKKTYPEASVTLASNGIKALEEIKNKEFNLVITDIKMPNFSGVDLIKEIRKINKDVKIFVVSGYESFDVIKSLLTLDVEDYLLKPLDFTEFVLILEKLLSPLQEKESDYSFYVKEVLNIIQNHYTENLTLDYLAQCVHLAPAYLSRKFTKEVGSGVNQFITQLKIEQAKRLLENTTLKINSIAQNSGFDNPSYFNKVFQTQTGYSPSEYRSLKRQD